MTSQAPNQAPVLTVSQITQAIKVQLETSFRQVWIQGEISNFRAQSSGHLYFSLKDSGAQISCVMFRGSTTTLQRQPRDGDQVIIQGEVNVYPPRGNYQLIIRSLTFSGVGQLLLRLEQLKKELHARGWFAPEIKKQLPPFPKRIGIVTSPTGAAIQDMLNVLNRRFAGVHVIINPVKVQGAGSADEIAQAIYQFNALNLVDVMIIGRGGGSIEDLWAFNEEIVAKAVFDSKIPIISAVGHETDYSISDLVADVRAPTPSAAAEIVVTEKAQHLQRLKTLSDRLQRSVTQQIHTRRQQLSHIARHPAIASPYHLLGMRMQRLDEMRNAIDRAAGHGAQKARIRLQALTRQLATFNPRTQILQLRQRLAHYSQGLEGTLWVMKRRRERLQHIAENLRAINPQNLLKKGYSILFAEKTNSVITSVQALSTTNRIRARLSDGELTATLNDIEVQCQNKQATPQN